MITHYVGTPEVDAYLADLVDRLLSLGPERPQVWLPIGPSGRILAERILEKNNELADNTLIVPVHFNRASESVSIDADRPEDIKGRDVLVLDSSVHSGSTMLAVVRAACERGASTVASYSLVLKRSSSFVPTFWGLTIDDYDRAYFLLDSIPNNRLKSRVAGPYLRRLAKTDIESLPPVVSGLASMDRITWADRWFDIQTSDRERNTYLLQLGATAVGFVTFVISDSRGTVTVDEVAVSEAMKSRGLGGLLLRFVETMARHLGASELNMWAVDNQVEKYERLGYEKAPSYDSMRLDGNEYFFMRKRIIHHISPVRVETS